MPLVSEMPDFQVAADWIQKKSLECVNESTKSSERQNTFGSWLILAARAGSFCMLFILVVCSCYLFDSRQTGAFVWLDGLSLPYGCFYLGICYLSVVLILVHSSPPF